MTEDRKLSPRFTLHQLTRTDHADLQEENRQIKDGELYKLCLVALKLEEVCALIGNIDVHSGRRCPTLNKRVGGSDKSQHLLCEAADISPAGPDTEESVETAFKVLAAAVKEKRLEVGQLIVESQGNGREGRKVWIHISLGAPYRELARCGQVLRMRDGKYEIVS